MKENKPRQLNNLKLSLIINVHIAIKYSSHLLIKQCIKNLINKDVGILLENNVHVDYI